MLFKDNLNHNKSRYQAFFKNFFKIRNLITLVCLYLLGILAVIIVELDFSKDFWQHIIKGKSSNTRIAIFSIKNRISEDLLYHRLSQVLQNEKIDYYGILLNDKLTHFFVTKHLYKQATNIINYLFKPSFNLALTHYVNILPTGVKIVYLNTPSSSLYNVYGNFLNQFSHLEQYDFYADLYSFVHQNNPILEKLLNQKQKIIPLYLAQNYIKYSPATIDKVILTGSLSGCSRDSLRNARALKRLADDDLLVAYGLKNHLSFLGRAYEGSFDSINGDIAQTIVSIQREYGIALITHNLEHMLEGMPTSKISEAAAAGALIISDNNYFIQKYFGNNVLYYDALGDDNKIYAEIKAHIQWARDNPEAAAIKAQNTYEVFAHYLTIEQQLKFLIEQVDNK